MITSFCKTMCDFSFRGRSSRKEFLYFFAIWLLISLLCFTIISSIAVTVLELKIDVINGLSIPSYKNNFMGLIFFVVLCLTLFSYIVFFLWSILAFSLLSIRRYHDMNYSGVCFWIFLSAIILFFVEETSLLTVFLGYFLFSVIIITAFGKSFPYPNKYGNPYNEEIGYKINNQHG